MEFHGVDTKNSLKLHVLRVRGYIKVCVFVPDFLIVKNNHHVFNTIE